MSILDADANANTADAIEAVLDASLQQSRRVAAWDSVPTYSPPFNDTMFATVIRAAAQYADRVYDDDDRPAVGHAQDGASLLGVVCRLHRIYRACIQYAWTSQRWANEHCGVRVYHRYRLRVDMLVDTVHADILMHRLTSSAPLTYGHLLGVEFAHGPAPPRMKVPRRQQPRVRRRLPPPPSSPVPVPMAAPHVGIVNTGVSCYLNALLQILLRNDAFRAYVACLDRVPRMSKAARRKVQFYQQVWRAFRDAEQRGSSSISLGDIGRVFPTLHWDRCRDPAEVFRKELMEGDDGVMLPHRYDQFENHIARSAFDATPSQICENVPALHGSVDCRNPFSFVLKEHNRFWRVSDGHSKDEVIVSNVFNIDVHAMDDAGGVQRVLEDWFGVWTGPDELRMDRDDSSSVKETVRKFTRYDMVTIPPCLMVVFTLPDPVCTPWSFTVSPNQRYELRALCLHIGRGGHYFARVYDPATGQCHEYNDERSWTFDDGKRAMVKKLFVRFAVYRLQEKTRGQSK